jgi:hypothetical protein
MTKMTIAFFNLLPIKIGRNSPSMCGSAVITRLALGTLTQHSGHKLGLQLNHGGHELGLELPPRANVAKHN